MSRALPFLLTGLALVGLAISAYLTIAHAGEQPIACGGLGDCNYVNSSEYASVAGIPVSALGGLLYLGLSVAGVAWLLRRSDDRPLVLYWGLALAGVGYAAYLTYVEVAVLHAICVWCVTSAAILLACLAGASWALFRPEDFRPAKDREPDRAAARHRHSATT